MDCFTEYDATAQASSIQPYGYTGRRYDAESGLYYFRNRMYSAVTGKFLSTDPNGEWDEINNINPSSSISYRPNRSRCSSCSSYCDNDYKNHGEEGVYQIKPDSVNTQKKYIDGLNIYKNYFVVNSRDPFGLHKDDTCKVILRYSSKSGYTKKTMSCYNYTIKKAKYYAYWYKCTGDCHGCRPNGYPEECLSYLTSGIFYNSKGETLLCSYMNCECY